MIIFQLQCETGHEFEGWFQDHDAFQDQMVRGLIQCPTCGSSSLTQCLSTGGIVRARDGGETPKDAQRAFVKALREVIVTHFEDVGVEFAKTALKMHYGVEDGRNIRGTTTEAEERMLKDEGVEFFKLPLPDPAGDSHLQ